MKSLKFLLIFALAIIFTLGVTGQASPEKDELAKAQQLANQGNTDEAIKVLTGMMEKYPDNFEVVQSYMMMKKFPDKDAGITAIEELVNKYPQNSAILFAKAFLMTEDGKLDQALALTEKLTAMKPDNSVYWLLKGQILEGMDKGNEAFDSYEKATSLDPKNANAWQIKAGMQAKMKKYDDAVASYTKAIELVPAQPVFIYNRGCAFCLKGDNTNALTDLAKAISLNPQFKSYATQDEDYKSLWDNEEFKK
ncbi:MAG: tetratricopeptide repeat protein, partial [Methanosarcina sp.]